jgi:hypothetical protein
VVALGVVVADEVGDTLLELNFILCHDQYLFGGQGLEMAGRN